MEKLSLTPKLFKYKPKNNSKLILSHMGFSENNEIAFQENPTSIP